MIPRISIIVPIYNVEEYLSKCIESILNQIFGDFELLLINDGSTDNSGIICDKYAKQDNRVSVIHKDNGGVSSARNLGIGYAKGQWITFIDSDDWVEKNWLHIVMEEINNSHEDIDLITYGYRRVNNTNIEYIYTPDNNITKDNIAFLKSFNYKHAVWTYSFKRSIINNYNIRFPVELKFSEDQAFLLKYISKSKSIYLINKVFYNYYNNSNSVVNKDIVLETAISNIIVANDFLVFCEQYNINKELYDYNICRLYKDFCIYFLKIKGDTKYEAKRSYKKLYLKTIMLYPDFKKHYFFKFLYYSWFLPINILRFKLFINKILNKFNNEEKDK